MYIENINSPKDLKSLTIEQLGVVAEDGRGCVLEMVSKLSDGRWLDMGGRRMLLDRGSNFDRSAFVDSLTGAYSRQYFECFLAESEQVEGVVMIDVDHFKEVNDRFGHLVGDKALQSVAQSILSNLRQTDVLVRYGGRLEEDGKTVRWVDTEDVLAMAYDQIIPGYGTKVTNTLRLWSAKATEEINTRYANKRAEETVKSATFPPHIFPNRQSMSPPKAN